MLLWGNILQTPELPCNESHSEDITGLSSLPITTLLATESIFMTYMSMAFCNAVVFFLSSLTMCYAYVYKHRIV